MTLQYFRLSHWQDRCSFCFCSTSCGLYGHSARSVPFFLCGFLECKLWCYCNFHVFLCEKWVYHFRFSQIVFVHLTWRFWRTLLLEDMRSCLTSRTFPKRRAAKTAKSDLSCRSEFPNRTPTGACSPRDSWRWDFFTNLSLVKENFRDRNFFQERDINFW